MDLTETQIRQVIAAINSILGFDHGEVGYYGNSMCQ
jgi:hypothetical protein